MKKAKPHATVLPPLSPYLLREPFNSQDLYDAFTQLEAESAQAVKETPAKVQWFTPEQMATHIRGTIMQTYRGKDYFAAERVWGLHGFNRQQLVGQDADEDAVSAQLRVYSASRLFPAGEHGYNRESRRVYTPNSQTIQGILSTACAVIRETLDPRLAEDGTEQPPLPCPPVKRPAVDGYYYYRGVWRSDKTLWARGQEKLDAPKAKAIWLMMTVVPEDLTRERAQAAYTHLRSRYVRR